MKRILLKRLPLRQIRAIKYLIFRSNDVSSDMKKICFALIDASKGLTRPVYFTHSGASARYGTREMVSKISTTHINEVFMVAGSRFKFSDKNGYFEKGEFKEGSKNEKEITMVTWLSNIYYDRKAKPISLRRVRGIVLEKPIVDSGVF